MNAFTLTPTRISRKPGESPKRRKTPSPIKPCADVASIHVSPSKRHRSPSEQGEGTPSKKQREKEKENVGAESNDLTADTFAAGELDIGNVKRVTFDFSIVTETGVLANDEQIRAIQAIFPGSEAITVHSPFIILEYGDHPLPPQPHPRTIAGAPAIFTTRHPAELLLADVHPGHGPLVEVKPPPIRFNRPTIDVLNAIASMYRRDFDCDISAIEWWDGRINIALPPSDHDTSRLPRRINNILVGYLKEPDAGEPPAPRRMEPTTGIPDDTLYDSQEFRPGLMLSSSLDGVERLTTSGIPVKDPEGRRYVTAAAHGLSGPGSAVYHPNQSGVEIGKMEKEIRKTDIALVALNEDRKYKYACQPFSSESLKAPTFFEFRQSGTLRLGDFLYLNSPFSGDWEATFLAERFIKIPADVPEKYDWVFAAVAHIDAWGKDDTSPPGICGSVVWDEEGRVVGFYHYESVGRSAVWPEASFIISAKPLMDMGMEIEAID